MTITCANGKWNKQVSCEPVDCGLPDKYHVHPADFKFPEGTTYGKKSTFQCREPAQLVGEMLRGPHTRKHRYVFLAGPERCFVRFSKNYSLDKLSPAEADIQYIHLIGE